MQNEIEYREKNKNTKLTSGITIQLHVNRQQSAYPYLQALYDVDDLNEALNVARQF